MPDKIAKFIASLSPKMRAKLKHRLILLKKSPYGGQDIKKLQGVPGEFYRLRFGKIRIIYEVKNTDIEIVDIDYRGNIY